MTTATQNDIVRLLPGIQDHTVLEILAMEATVAELEALVQLLQDDDEGLIEVWGANYYSPHTSRLTVEGARPNDAAIQRSDWPVATPREISSRSASVNAMRDR